KDDSEYLEKAAAGIFTGSGTRGFKDGREIIKLNTDALNGCPKALSSRLVRMAVGFLRNDTTGLEKKHVDEVLSLAGCGKTGSIIQLPREITVEKGYAELYFYRA